MKQILVYLMTCMLTMSGLMSSCFYTYPDSSPVPTQTAAPTATPTAVPVQTPTPTSAPSPEPTIEPSPEPTLEPHIWNEHFSVDEHVMLNSDDASGADWIYSSPDLGIKITRMQSMLIAEVWCKDGISPYTSYLVDYDPAAELTGSEISAYHGAVLGITGDFSALADDDSGIVIRGGEILSEGKGTDTLAIMPDGSLAVYYAGKIKAQELVSSGVTETLSCGPLLISDGEINSKLKKNKLNAADFRSSVGMIEPGHFLFIANIEKITLQDLAQVYADRGAVCAYNLTGGEYTTMTFMSEQINASPFVVWEYNNHPLVDMLLIGYTEIAQ